MNSSDLDVSVLDEAGGEDAKGRLHNRAAVTSFPPALDWPVAV